MAVTKTESAMGLLNYNLQSRQSRTDSSIGLSDSYPTAVKQIIDIFSNGVAKGKYSEATISDFNEQLSLVSVMDNKGLYKGIDSLPVYCGQLTQVSTYENNNTMVR